MKKNIIIIICSIIIILIIALLIFIVNNKKNSYLKDINYIEYIEKVNNSENFILYVKQNNCSHCLSFTPEFTEILKKYDIEAFSINLTELDQKDRETFINELSVEETPTVLFFNNGIELGKFSRIVGSKKENYVVNKLKQNGFIKEEKKQD